MFIAKAKSPMGRNQNSTGTSGKSAVLKSAMMLLLGSAFLAPMVGAAEARPASIKSKSLSVDAVYQNNTVRVISRGHEKFDTIEDGGNLKVRVRGHIDPRGVSKVLVGGFLLGQCTGAPNCSQFTVRYIHSATMRKKKWSFDHELNVPTDIISHSGSSGIAPFPDGDRLIQACNYAMNGRGPVEAVTLDNYLTISASAHTHKWRPFDGFFSVGNWNETYYGGDVGVSDTFPIKVECVPSQKLLETPISVSNRAVDTASGAQGSCPRRVEHTTSIYYRQPMTARFKIKQNGQVVKTVERSTVAEPLSNGTTQHVIHYETELMSPEGQNNYRVKVVGGPESMNDRLTINCNEFDITFANLTHTAPNNNKCPRQVWQTSSFITNGPGEFTYQLKHKLFGVIYEKELEAVQHGNQYKAVDTRVIQMTEGTAEFLAQVKGSDGIHSGWQPVTIECEAKVKPELEGGIGELTGDQQDPGQDLPKPPVKVNPLVGAAIGGLTGTKTPTHADPKPAPKTPRIPVKVAPPVTKLPTPKTVDPKPAPERPRPQVAVCKGGKIRNNNCLCPKTTRKVKISRFEYLCKKRKVATPGKPKKPVRTNPTPKLVCVGGKQRYGFCACPKRGEEPKKIGKRKYKCEKVAGAKRTNPDKKAGKRTNPKKDEAKRTNGKKKNAKRTNAKKKSATRTNAKKVKKAKNLRKLKKAKKAKKIRRVVTKKAKRKAKRNKRKKN